MHSSRICTIHFSGRIYGREGLSASGFRGCLPLGPGQAGVWGVSTTPWTPPIHIPLHHTPFHLTQPLWKECITDACENITFPQLCWHVVTNGGSKGLRVPGEYPPGYGRKFSQFHAVFQKIWQNHMLAPHLLRGILDPPPVTILFPTFVDFCISHATSVKSLGSGEGAITDSCHVSRIELRDHGQVIKLWRPVAYMASPAASLWWPDLGSSVLAVGS